MRGPDVARGQVRMSANSDSTYERIHGEGLSPHRRLPALPTRPLTQLGTSSPRAHPSGGQARDRLRVAGRRPDA